MATRRRSFLGSVGAALCSFTGVVRGSGNVVTHEYEFREFERIQVGAAFDVDVTRSDTFSVVVQADDNLFDLIKVRKRGDTLRLGLKPHVHIWGGHTMEASITMPEVRGVEVSGAAYVDLQGFDNLDAFDAVLSGASELTGTLTARSIAVEASGASRMAMGGQTADLILNGSGASKIDLTRLPAAIVDACISGASRTRINVTDQIKSADVSGASSLRYQGDPTLTNIVTSGASRIDRIPARETSS